MATPQGARPRLNRPATSQAAVQLLEVINEVTEKLQGEEEVEESYLVYLVQDPVEDSPQQPQ